jgi:hypothetical protein
MSQSQESEESKKSAVSLDQITMTAQFHNIIEWMRQYEERAGVPENQRTQKLESVRPDNIIGFCHGLSLYLMHSVITDQRILEKKAQGLKIDEDPYTEERFFSKLHKINSGQTPLLTDEKEAKEFYKEMDIFINQVYGLQGHIQNSNAQTALKDLVSAELGLEAIMEVFAPKDTGIKIIDNYPIRNIDQLIELAKQSNPGDQFLLKTSIHMMLMYTKLDIKGEKKVCFYDANSHVRNDDVLGELSKYTDLLLTSSEYMKKMIKGSIFGRNPFDKEYHPGPDSLIRAQHIVDINSQNQALDFVLDLKDILSYLMKDYTPLKTIDNIVRHHPQLLSSIQDKEGLHILEACGLKSAELLLPLIPDKGNIDGKHSNILHFLPMHTKATDYIIDAAIKLDPKMLFQKNDNGELPIDRYTEYKYKRQKIEELMRKHDPELYSKWAANKISKEMVQDIIKESINKIQEEKLPKQTRSESRSH